MGYGAMGSLSIQEAAKQAGASKVDVWHAIQAGALLARRTDDGGLAIDPAQLFRVFEPQRPKERPMEQDGTASLEALGRPETTPEPNATPETPETAPTNEMAVAFAPELIGLVALPAEAPATDEPRQNRDEGQGANLAERTADPAEPAAERAKTDKAMIAKYAALGERASPWWRRLVGWLHTCRGRAARQRLRERL
jgi:hypothetical protein